MQPTISLGAKGAISWAIGITLALSLCATARADYQWQTYATPITTSNPQLAIHAGQLYVLGGSEDSAGTIWSNQLSSLNLASNQWQDMQGTLPYGMQFSNMSPLVIGDGMIISPNLGPTFNGGWGTHNSVVEYSFAADQFAQTAQYPQSTIWGCVLANAGTASNPNIYSFGGWTGSGVSDIFQYNTVTETLTQSTTASLSAGRAIAAAWAAPNGSVYLFGGNVSGIAQRVDVFDPSTGIDSSLGDIYPADMLLPDVGLAANAIAWTDASGNAIVLCTEESKAYEFDPATNSFTPYAMTFPTPDSGYSLNPEPYYDPTTGDIYLTESQWTGSTWETNLVVGTPVPEPGSLSVVTLGSLGLLMRRRPNQLA